MIAGYELKRQVIDHLAALEREKASVQLPGHLARIEEEEERFRAELKKMDTEGYGDEHERTAHPAAGTPYYWPPHRPGTISGI